MSKQLTIKDERANLQINYEELLAKMIDAIQQARTALAMQIASIEANTYWRIGQILYESKVESAHGEGVVKRLSADLKEKFPDLGTSTRNLWSMKQFYVRYKDCDEKLLRSVALLPWKHNLLLLNKDLDDVATRYYATEVVTKGWNADILLNAIKMQMHLNATPAYTDNNFSNALPAAQAEYANQIFRSTYNLGFLGVTKPIAELDLESRLVEKVKLLLLELGKGFTYIGNQHELEYNGKTSKVDMLFYHRGLRCLVAIDLKIGAFIPEYVGKMNYYLSLLDRLERQPDENPSIGIILCAEKDKVQVELALEGYTKPIGVADYQLIIPKKEIEQVIKNELVTYNEEKQNNN